MESRKGQQRGMNAPKGGKVRTEYAAGLWKNKNCQAAVFAFCMVCALPAMLCVSGDRLWYTNSVLAVLLWVLLTGCMKQVLVFPYPKKKHGFAAPGLLGFGFSICMVFGAALERQENVNFTDGGMWLSILVLGVSFALIVRYMFEQMRQLWKEKSFAAQKDRQQRADSLEQADGESRQNFEKRTFRLRAGLILLCYLPVFLAVYPGFFVYDAQDELMQVITRSFSTHHPLMHVLFMGGVIQLVYKISGSYNLGIACYTILQMAILACIFSYGIGLLQKSGMKKKNRVIMTLYFGLFPVIVMFSLCSAKDGLFMGMVLLQVMMLRELIKDPEQFWAGKGWPALFAAASLGMMLLRHNGFYAFVVFALLVAGISKKSFHKANRKKTAVLLGGIIIVYLVINQGLTLFLRADASENQELLTVPIQQLARVHEMEGDTLSAEEKQTLYRYLPEEALARYTPKVSDGVKAAFQNETYRTDKGTFFSLWLKLGLKHPFSYLNGWLMTSYGFWYPDTVIDVYRGNSVFTYTYEDSSYFGYEVEQPGIRESKFPALDELYRRLSLEITQQRIPLISMLFSPGFLFFVSAFLLCFLWYMGAWKKAVPYMLPIFIWLTFLLGPTYLVRYVVYLWCLLPVLLLDAKSAVNEAVLREESNI